MTRLALATALLLTAAQSWAADMTPADAFEAGKAFGLSPQGAEAAMKAISGASAADKVPYYDTANANSTYYGGGVGDLLTPGTARVTECSTAVYPDAKRQVECDAINDMAKNRAKRPPLVIAPNDPILVKGKTIKGDPASVAGAFGGAYTACSTIDVVKPATYEEEICNEYRSLGEEVCQKQLTVTVTESSSCVTGTDVATYIPGIGYCSKASGRDWWYGPGALKVRCDSIDQTKLYVAAETLVREGSYGASGCRAGVRPKLDLLPYRAVSAYNANWTEVYGDYGGGSIYHLYIRGGCMAGQTNCSLEVVASTKQLASIATCPAGQITSQEAESYGCVVYPNSCYTTSGWWGCPTYVGPASISQMLCDDGGWSDSGPVGWVNCEAIVPSTTLNFQRQHITYTTSDSWSDGCVTLEARTR
jgi:hypothetical protein